MAICPRDGAPLIATMAFRKAEFYCLECGGRFGFLEPRAAEVTPELTARHEALQAEWDAHAGERLITDGWYANCAKCDPRGETHMAHATTAELHDHELALEWLRERAGKVEAPPTVS